MRPWWKSLAAARRRNARDRLSAGQSLRSLVVDEVAWVLRRSVRRGKLAVAIVVAVATIAAFGPMTPGLVLSEGWRLALAIVLGLVAAVVAHGLLQRSQRQEHAGDPRPALRAVLAAAALLITGTVALAYLMAAVTGGSTDPASAEALNAGLPVDRPLLIGAALLAGGVLAAALGARLSVPGALVFLGLGMVIGENGLGWISLADTGLVQSLAVCALVIILFEGGLTTDMDQLRRGAAPGLVLATVGVGITAGVTALGAMWLLDVPSNVAWLVGATVASTDAAAVFGLLRRAPIPERLAAILKVESGANDPVAVLLTVGLLASWQTPTSTNAWLVFGAVQLIGGAAVGAAIGWLGARLLRRAELGTAGLYPMLALALAGVTYGVAVTVGASGFLAVYIAGIVLAAEVPRRRRALLSFHEALANGAEVGMFLLLGQLVSPSQLIAVAPTALAVVAVMTFVGRPLACAIGLAPLGFSAREITVVSWLGLRGAVPIVLATFAFSAGIENAGAVFAVVFFIVLTSALIQGTTAIPLIKRLGLDTAPSPVDVVTDALPIEGTGIDVVEVTVPQDSVLVGQLLRDAPAPESALVAALARGEQVLLPRGDTRICPGDLLMVTTTDGRHGIQRIEEWVRQDTPEPDAAPGQPPAGGAEGPEDATSYGVKR
jgi:cell volume regulation protein A